MLSTLPSKLCVQLICRSLTNPNDMGYISVRFPVHAGKNGLWLQIHVNVLQFMCAEYMSCILVDCCFD